MIARIQILKNGIVEYSWAICRRRRHKRSERFVYENKVRYEITLVL